MKSVTVASISALFLLSLVGPRWAAAQTPGSYAAGTYRFLLEEDGVAKTLDFNASTDDRGVTTGDITFLDPRRVPDTDDPEDPKGGDAPPEFAVKATFDSLTVEKNRALMNGRVVDSTHRTYIGKWVQLVVEDNVENPRFPDTLTWSFCALQPGGWIPSDAERKYDDGAYLSWWATDAERKDDVGIPSPNIIPGGEKSCLIYPLSVYTMVDLLKWEGDIVVQSPR